MAGAWAPTTCGCSGEAEAERRVRVAGLLDAALTPHCAAVHPARLARGLDGRAAGTPIYESTEATRIRPGRVDTARGAVTAEVVVRPPRATA